MSKWVCYFAPMSLNRSITRFLKLSLLFLFIGYYSSVTLFYHSHIVNGQIIIHSHFFKSNTKTPLTHHSHPVSAYNLINELNKISCEELIVTSPYEQQYIFALSTLECFVHSEVIIPFDSSVPTRSPPVC